MALTCKEAFAKLPPSILVGPFDFKIEIATHLVSSGRGEWGSCSLFTFVISVQEDFPSVVKAVDTFLHEVGHAIWFAMRLDDGDKQERIIASLATGWVGVYRANPWLLGWLAECLA